MGFDKAKYQREYMREKRRKSYADAQPGIGAEKGENGRYPDREYNEDGSLKLFEQRCEPCGGLRSASIVIPCPYCDGSGKRRATTR